MSLKLIESEIKRFLADPEPEVLCIKGKWGVGKTHTWDQLLAQAHAHPGELAMQKYSYVTLFGLNSLEDLRFSIFENTVSGAHLTKSATVESLTNLVSVGSDLARKARHLVDFAAAVTNRKAVTDVLLKAGFLNVRSQLVCIDDLERAGKGLEVRDVLGLISFLKTKRACKVVLLLNDEQFSGDNKAEFDRQLEKVADAIMVFDLLPEEASAIAFRGEENAVQAIIKPLIVTLRITNIRIIKKIERASDRLAELLKDYEKPVINQALTALVLGMWAHLESGTPSIAFIKAYNGIFDSITSNNKQDDQDVRFAEMLEPYPYSSTDELDSAVLDGAEAGYFDDQRVLEMATLVASRNQKVDGGDRFNRVWNEMYHGSLSVDDDVFLDALFEAAVHDAAVITPLNINSAIKMLRENKRVEQADELIDRYIDAKSGESLEFFDIGRDHFALQDGVDPKLKAAFEAKFASYEDNRVPLDVLKDMAFKRSWSAADVAALSKLSAEDFETMFEQLDGERLRWAIETVVNLGNSVTQKGGPIRSAVREGLRRIARKSPIRAQKITRFGVRLDEPESQGAPEIRDVAVLE